MQDILLRNGLLCDGTRNKPYVGDIAIKGGKITRIAAKIEDGAETVVDVQGLVVSPGFIDMHSHSDVSFLRDDRCESKIYQGVTSEVVGQCGMTIYPCAAGHIEDMYTFAGTDLKFDKRYYTSYSLQEFIDKVQKNGKRMATNLLPLIGHGALRAGVVGFAGRKVTEVELQAMAELLDRDMQYGAWGLSLGLGYAPGLFADQTELNALGEVVHRYDGVITSHMRSQSVRIFEALEEMYGINRATGAKVHIAHLKICGKGQLGKSGLVIEHLKNAVRQGVQVTKDMYPYTAASTDLTDVLPKWSLEGGLGKAAERFNTDERPKLMQHLEENYRTRADGESIHIVTTYGRYPAADNKNVYQLSQELGVSMPEALEKVIVATKGKADCVYFIMLESDVMNYMKEADVAIGSDGYGYAFDEGISPHPRSFGTFPRFLRLARENKLCELAVAVHRITKLPADIVGLKDRGVLRKGLVADITVFDPAAVADTATYSEPCRKPVGIEHVIIGGQFAVRRGNQTDKRLGQILLKNK